MKKFLILALVASFVVAQENEKNVEKWSNGVVKIKHYYIGQGFNKKLH